MKRPVPRLLVITDTTLQTSATHAELARLAIEGGADGIQYRQKEGATSDLLRQAEAVRRVCETTGTTLIVNDRLDIALAVEADGLHVGQDDLPARVARRLFGWNRLLGVSAHTLTQGLTALSDSADYVGFGPVYGTRSKADARPATGVEALRRFVRDVRLPVIAIGGIREENVPELLDAGAHGVAVLSAVCCADDVARATEAFTKRLEERRSAT